MCSHVDYRHKSVPNPFPGDSDHRKWTVQGGVLLPDTDSEEDPGLPYPLTALGWTGPVRREGMRTPEDGTIMGRTDRPRCPRDMMVRPGYKIVGLRQWLA